MPKDWKENCITVNSDLIYQVVDIHSNYWPIPTKYVPKVTTITGILELSPRQTSSLWAISTKDTPLTVCADKYFFLLCHWWVAEAKRGRAAHTSPRLGDLSPPSGASRPTRRASHSSSNLLRVNPRAAAGLRGGPRRPKIHPKLTRCPSGCRWRSDL